MTERGTFDEDDPAPPAFVMTYPMLAWLLKIAVARTGTLIVTDKDNLYALPCYQFAFEEHDDGFTVRLINLEEHGAGHAD